MYFSEVDETGQSLKFDSDKIKVTVTESMNIGRFPIVKLKRLPKLDTAKWTKHENNRISDPIKIDGQKSNQDSPNTKEKDIAEAVVPLTDVADEINNVPEPTNSIRSTVIRYPTRAKQSNSHEDNAKHTIEKPNLKRKNEMQSSKLTNAKKKKESSENGLPTTIEIDEGKNDVVSTFVYTVGETVWAKIRYWPHWPCKVEEILPNRKYKVRWYNDYRTSTVFRTQMFKFGPNFEKFAVNFPTSIGLETAAKEALISLAQRK